jgi:putative hydrolase of the HAD superfamily
LTPYQPKGSRPPAARAAVFDLGNVLIDIDFMRCMRHWSRCTRIPAEQIATRYRVDRHYEAFERGRLSPEAYFDVLRRQLEIDLDDADFTAGWNRIIMDEIPGVRSCILRLKPHLPLYVLTNTNAVHAAEWRSRHAGLLQHFEHVFVSSEMGCRKPDAAVYQAVIAAIGIPADQIVFMDDDPANVQGAAAVGLRASLIKKPDDIIRLTAGLLAGTPR